MNFNTTNALYLCIDQGGHASRAIVYNNCGEIIASAYADVDTQHPEKYFVELKAKDVIDSINNSINQVIEKLGDQRHQIASAGLATQRSNVVCWDKNTGQALSPVISWQDRRNNDWLQKLKKHNDDIHKITGLFMSPHYGASKLRWCIDNIPTVKEALKSKTLAMGPMASFIVSQLVEEKSFFTDPVNASRTQLWSLTKNNWDDELLKLFDIPISALPECVSSTHDYGTLNIDGLKIPLQLVSGDQSAAMYAYGQLQADTAYVNTGTGAFLSRPSGPLQLYSRRLLTSIIFQNNKDKHYVLEGTVNGAGCALEWLAEQYPEDDIYKQLPIWLKEVKDPPLFLNGISGLAAPFWVAHFKSEFSREASLAEKAVAIIDSIVFLLKASLDEMGKLSSPPEQIQITGGLSTLKELSQRLADISELPVYCPVESEATARGTAYLLAQSPSSWPEKEAGEWFKATQNDQLKKRYAEWLRVMLKKMRK